MPHWAGQTLNPFDSNCLTIRTYFVGLISNKFMILDHFKEELINTARR